MRKYSFIQGIAVCENQLLFASRFVEKSPGRMEDGEWEPVFEPASDYCDYSSFPEMAHENKVIYIALISKIGDIICFDPSCMKVEGMGYIDGSVQAFNELINCSDSVIFE